MRIYFLLNIFLISVNIFFSNLTYVKNSNKSIIRHRDNKNINENISSQKKSKKTTKRIRRLPSKKKLKKNNINKNKKIPNNKEIKSNTNRYLTKTTLENNENIIKNIISETDESNKKIEENFKKEENLYKKQIPTEQVISDIKIENNFQIEKSSENMINPITLIIEKINTLNLIKNKNLNDIKNKILIIITNKKKINKETLKKIFSNQNIKNIQSLSKEDKIIFNKLSEYIKEYNQIIKKESDINSKKIEKEEIFSEKTKPLLEIVHQNNPINNLNNIKINKKKLLEKLQKSYNLILTKDTKEQIKSYVIEEKEIPRSIFLKIHPDKLGHNEDKISEKQIKTEARVITQLINEYNNEIKEKKNNTHTQQEILPIKNTNNKANITNIMSNIDKYDIVIDKRKNKEIKDLIKQNKKIPRSIISEIHPDKFYSKNEKLVNSASNLTKIINQYNQEIEKKENEDQSEENITLKNEKQILTIDNKSSSTQNSDILNNQIKNQNQLELIDLSEKAIIQNTNKSITEFQSKDKESQPPLIKAIKKESPIFESKIESPLSKNRDIENHNKFDQISVKIPIINEINHIPKNQTFAEVTNKESKSTTTQFKKNAIQSQQKVIISTDNKEISKDFDPNQALTNYSNNLLGIKDLTQTTYTSTTHPLNQYETSSQQNPTNSMSANQYLMSSQKHLLIPIIPKHYTSVLNNPTPKTASIF